MYGRVGHPLGFLVSSLGFLEARSRVRQSKKFGLTLTPTWNDPLMGASLRPVTPNLMFDQHSASRRREGRFSLRARMPEYVCPTCERHFHKWTVCKEHLEASGHAAGSGRRALRKWADHADAQTTGTNHAGAQSTGGWSISREPALKKQRTPSSSDGATFWHQLLQMELAAQEAQVQHRLETWSNEALCQVGTRLQGLEAKLIGPKKSRSLSLRCAAGVRLPNNAFKLGDVAIVSCNEPESMAVRMGMYEPLHACATCTHRMHGPRVCRCWRWAA